MSSVEQCPTDREVAAWLWEHNKPVLDELRSIVEPLAEELCTQVDTDVSHGDAVTRETVSTPVLGKVPFGLPYTLLPPRFFSGLGDEPQAPHLPQTEAEARQLIEAYSQRCLESPLPGMPEGSYTAPPEARMGHILSDLMWMVERGIVIDPVVWERYRQAGREQAEQGRYDLDMISLARGNSVKNMYNFTPLVQLAYTHATGRFEYFATMPTAALDVDGPSFGLLPAGYLFMPEGAYGSRFSEKVLRTTAYMINRGQQVLGELAGRLAEEHPDAVEQHTTRRRDGRPADASLVSVTQEGLRSNMEVIALLTADKVQGYGDPDELLESIINQGIIEEFTRAIPMGFLGPLVFAGKYFPNLLLHNGQGKLILNPLVMEAIKLTKRIMARQVMAEWIVYWSASEEERQNMMPPTATSLLCPAVMPHGALTRMNGSLLRAYQSFDF